MPLALFVAFALLYGITALGRIDSYDGEMMFRVTESLVMRGSLQITDEVFHASEPYSVFGLGTSLALIPLYVLSRITGLDARWVAAFLNPLVTAATVALLYRFALALGLSRALALTASLGFGLASLAWPFAKTLFSEPLTALLLLAAAYAARCGRPLWLGLALGFAVLTRTDTVLVAPFFVLYALPWPGIARAVAGVAFTPFAIVTLAYHFLRFGGLVGTYTERTGAEMLFDVGHVMTGVYGHLFSTGKGLFIYTPLAILALPGLLRMYAALPREALLLGALMIERIVLFSLFSRWWGGIVWGPRYLVPLVPFAIVAATYYLHGQETPWRRAVYAMLVGGGFVAALAGISTFYTDGLDVILGRGASWEEMLYVPRHSPLRVHVERMISGEARGWLVPAPSP